MCEKACVCAVHECLYKTLSQKGKSSLFSVCLEMFHLLLLDIVLEVRNRQA